MHVNYETVPIYVLITLKESGSIRLKLKYDKKRVMKKVGLVVLVGELKMILKIW